MIRIATALLVCLVVPACSFGQRRGARVAPESEQAPPLAKSALEKRVLAQLGEMVNQGDLYANVPAADGRMLRLLTESMNAKHVVEIGTSTGISGLWFALALERTGGRLTTFEYDPKRAASARANFRKAGVDKLIAIVEGDAHQTVTQLKDPIDIVFIDADKEGYVDYLNKLLPLVRPGGLLLAHNTDMIPDYLKAVAANPDLETVHYTTGGGMAVTLKKR